MVSGSCFRVNPKGNLRGKSGEYGVLSIHLLADSDEYFDDRHPGWIIATHEHQRYGSSIDSGGKIAPGFVYSMNINTMIVSTINLYYMCVYNMLWLYVHCTYICSAQLKY